MSKYKRRTDSNHRQLITDLKSAFCRVIDASKFAQFEPGFPDLIVARGGVVLLVEVKRPGYEQQLTPAEYEFHHLYDDVAMVATCAEDVLAELEARS